MSLFVRVLRRVNLKLGKKPKDPKAKDFEKTAAVSFSGRLPLKLKVRVTPNNAKASVEEIGRRARPRVSHKKAKKKDSP